MDIESKMSDIIKRRMSLNNNDDYGIEKCWNLMTNILTKSEIETIDYLNQCGEIELYYISEIFDDISESLQSELFIDCLRKLEKKYPNLDLAKDIDIAESYL